MLNRKQRARALRDCMKKTLFPPIESQGFQKLKHSGLFYGFWRVREDRFEIIEIQWDKYHRARFAVNFGASDVEVNDGRMGVRNAFTDAWHPLEDASESTLLTLYRIRRGLSQWFKFRSWRSLLTSDGAQVVTNRALALLPLIEGWFDADPECIRMVDRMNR